MRRVPPGCRAILSAENFEGPCCLGITGPSLASFQSGGGMDGEKLFEEGLRRSRWTALAGSFGTSRTLQGCSQAEFGPVWVGLTAKSTKWMKDSDLTGVIYLPPMKSALGNLWSRLMAVRSRCPVVRLYGGSAKRP